MTNIRQRKNVRFSPDEAKNDQPSGFQKVRMAVENLMSNRKSRKTKLQKIEEMSVWPYVLFFFGFLTFSIYLVDYMHRWENGELDNDVLQSVEYTNRFVEVSCSNDYGKAFKSCRPKKCGRAVRDGLFLQTDLKHMRDIAEKGMKHGGGKGGATILDLHSGALSYGDQFINLHAANKKVFNTSDFEVYSKIRNTIQDAIAEEFEIEKKVLFLTKPTFFSRLTNKSASTKHDEYWHQHIDRVTYGTFFYTSLLYLSDYSVDFTGGRFIFVDNNVNKTVEPRMGRLSFFTSGSENVHFVERVESGMRFAITVSFTCNKKHKINDPSL